jgi:hypothetical protein
MVRTGVPQWVQDALGQLGEPEAVFRPGGQGFVHMVVAVVGVLALGALALGAWAECGAAWVVIVLALAAVLLPLLAWCLFWLEGETLVLVCPGGLAWARGGVVETLLWTHIRRVVERKRQIVADDLKELFRYRIETSVGSYWVLDSGQVAAIEQLATLLKRNAERFHIPWTIEVVESGTIEELGN